MALLFNTSKDQRSVHSRMGKDSHTGICGIFKMVSHASMAFARESTSAVSAFGNSFFCCLRGAAAVMAAAVMVLLPLGLSSCRSLSYNPVFTISLHEFSDVGESRLAMWVQDTGRKHSRRVMKYGFLTSRDITAAELTGPDEKGKYGLLLQVSPRRLNDVSTTAGSNSGMLFAVIMDGTYVGSAHFTKSSRQAGIFEVEPIFGEYVASMIVSHVEQNYDYYTR